MQWPMFHYDAKNTGRSPYQGSLAAGLKWTYRTGYIIYSSPAIGMDGAVYLGSYDERLYSVNSDGSFSWSYQSTGGSGASSLRATGKWNS